MDISRTPAEQIIIRLEPEEIQRTLAALLDGSRVLDAYAQDHGEAVHVLESQLTAMDAADVLTEVWRQLRDVNDPPPPEEYGDPRGLQGNA